MLNLKGAGEEFGKKARPYAVELSNLAQHYAIRARIEFALRDDAGAQLDAEAAQDRLSESLVLDKENFKLIARQSQEYHLDRVVMLLLQGERGAACALYGEKVKGISMTLNFESIGVICASAPQSQDEQRSPSSEIDDVVRSGRYSQLPPAQMVAGGAGSGPSHIALVNGTRYTLTVMFSGPAESSATVPPDHLPPTATQHHSYPCPCRRLAGPGSRLYSERSA
jgi:hypothetical protein